MYGSRRVNNSLKRGQKSQLNSGLLGIAVGANDGRPKPPVAMAPPPSMLPPPSPQPPALPCEGSSPGMCPPSLSSESVAEDDYQPQDPAKAQLDAITGRMFQVLNEWEDDGNSSAKGYVNEIGSHLDGIQDRELKNNIQLMIADYKDMCVEREELLYSLADWFDDNHIDDMLEDVQHRKMSLAADPKGLRQSLLDAKHKSDQLKAIKEEVFEAESLGLSTEHLLQTKQELEHDLMQSVELRDKIQGKQSTSNAVIDSWKFAAVEICNLLQHVRENGLDGVHDLETKIQQMVDTMQQQSTLVEKLTKDLAQQKQEAMFSNMTTTRLSDDTALLKEELDVLRERLLEAKETISELQTELHSHQLEKETRAAGAKTTRAMSGRDYKLRNEFAVLSERAALLQEENEELKTAYKVMQNEFEITQSLLSDEQAHPQQLASHTSDESDAGAETEPVAYADTPTEARCETVTQSVKKTHDSVLANRIISSVGSRQATANTQKLSASACDVKVLLQAKAKLQTQLAESDHQVRVAHLEIERLRCVIESRGGGAAGTSEPVAQFVGTREVSSVEDRSSVLPSQSHHNPVKMVQAYPSSYRRSTQADLSSIQHAISHMPTAEHSDLPVVKETTSGHVTPYTTAATGSHDPVGAMTTNDPRPPSNHMWSMGQSVAIEDGEFDFDTEKDKSLQLVIELIEKVNANQSSFAEADSEALEQVHSELQKVCNFIMKFLEYSTTLVNDEAKTVSNAVDTLMSQLPNHDRPDFNSREMSLVDHLKDTSLAGIGHNDEQRLKNKVVHFADQAIQVLKAGETTLSTKIRLQQKRLSTVLNAMTEHKRQQSQAFKFLVPDADIKGLVLEAKQVGTHALREKPAHSKQHTAMERLHYYAQLQGHKHNGGVYHSRAHNGQLHDDNGSGLYGLQLKNGVLRDHHHHHHPHEPSSNTTTFVSNRLQITNTTDRHQQPSSSDTGHASPGIYSRFGFTQDHPGNQASVATDNRGLRKKKPKLYKPFNLHGGGERSSKVVSDWQALTAGRRKTGGARGGRQVGARSGGGEGAEFGGWQGNRNSLAANRTTFYDVFNQTNTMMQQQQGRPSRHTPPSSDQNTSVRLPPITM